MTTRSSRAARASVKTRSKFRRTRLAKPAISTATNSGGEYRVGPGRPPKEFQFKPGQSGNPKGRKRKHPIVPDLKATLERALNRKVALAQGEKEQIVSKVEAGINQLVDAFAAGDRHARRDLIDLALRLGVDLLGNQRRAIESALHEPISAQDQAVLQDYLRRHGTAPDDSSEALPTKSTDSQDNGE